MTRNRRAVALLLAILLSLVAIYAWRQDTLPPEEPSSVTAAPTASRESAPLPSAPPRDASPRSPLAAVQARADAGDGVAACQLAITLMRCQVASRKEPAEAVCESLPDELTDRAQHYLRTAALAGEPTSRYWYAVGAGYQYQSGYAYLRAPEFDQWRREAAGLMRSAFVDGQEEAALALAFAYGNGDGLFAGLLADDDFQAYAHRRLAEQLFGESLAAFPVPLPVTLLPPAEAARADALAAGWHQAHFAGRRIDMMKFMQYKSSAPWRVYADAASADGPCQAPGGMTRD